MGIASGLAGLKAAAELTKTLREAAKSGSLKPDEFAGRVGEIYDYIVDSKDALIEAKDEIQDLKNRLQAVTAMRRLTTNWNTMALYSGETTLMVNTVVRTAFTVGGKRIPSFRLPIFLALSEEYTLQSAMTAKRMEFSLCLLGKRLLNVLDQFPVIGGLLLGVDCLQ